MGSEKFVCSWSNEAKCWPVWRSFKHFWWASSLEMWTLKRVEPTFGIIYVIFCINLYNSSATPGQIHTFYYTCMTAVHFYHISFRITDLDFSLLFVVYCCIFFYTWCLCFCDWKQFSTLSIPAFLHIATKPAVWTTGAVMVSFWNIHDSSVATTFQWLCDTNSQTTHTKRKHSHPHSLTSHVHLGMIIELPSTHQEKLCE